MVPLPIMWELLSGMELKLTNPNSIVCVFSSVVLDFTLGWGFPGFWFLNLEFSMWCSPPLPPGVKGLLIFSSKESSSPVQGVSWILPLAKPGEEEAGSSMRRLKFPGISTGQFLSLRTVRLDVSPFVGLWPNPTGIPLGRFFTQANRPSLPYSESCARG